MLLFLEYIFKIFIFPGVLFLSVYSFVLEFTDRKLYARMQSRVGPPWYQPLADFLKLIGKNVIIPADANRFFFSIMPFVSLAAVTAGFMYVPLFGTSAVFSFRGDLIIVLYFLAIPPLAGFLAGWYSRGVYATIGATRILTQMFAYEVPLFISLLAPALIADTWSVSEITAFYAAHPLYTLINLPCALTALIAFQCKLERAPFDSPEAETEVVSGALVEYSGRLLAFFNMAHSCELVLVVSLFAAIYLPFMTGIIWLDFLLYFVKTLFILVFLTLMRASMARVVINRVITFFWTFLSPVALGQIILNLLLRGVMHI
ncbi:MAG TPA: NADH-quinone oxidoreductase subunit H [Clostridiales bacterium]|nr:NADH-quinone oxidoreductase subunit H [Clostridiales bacterium]